MNPRTTDTKERAELQAACDFLRLSPDELVAWAPQSDTKRMRRMRKTAIRVLRERIHDLHTETRTEETP